MQESKHCPCCGTVKLRSRFARSKNRSGGLQSYCRECIANLDHARYEREVGRSVLRRTRRSYGASRGAWLRSLKAGRPCTDCGRVFDPQVMQWDHLPGFEKLGEISQGGSWIAGRTEEEILAEVRKCELVCTNCHTLRTFRRRGWGSWSVKESQGNYDVTRTCAKCGERKSMGEFHRSRTGQFSYCRDCRRAYDRRYYAERGKPARSARMRAWRASGREWMDTLKAGRPCADCGDTFPPCVMHWDHLPEYIKLGEISSMVANRQRTRVLEELAKCELVCANCHVMRTVRRARRTIGEEARDYWFTSTSVA